MTPQRLRLAVVLLRLAPALLFVVMVIGFGLWAPRFLSAENALNILVQSSAVGIVATGMTLVLVTAGIDLSVGSIMFLSAIAAGKLAIAGAPIWLALAAVPVVGLLCGAVNALLIAGPGMRPFIVTLATLYIGRGLGLFVTQTREMQLPAEVLSVGAATIVGIPMPVVLMLAVMVAAQLFVGQTSIGRQFYAVGHDPESARTAGIHVRRIIALAYVVSGACAALGGLVLVSQLAAVDPKLGEGREFDAIAAVVLGGTSLFGGKGRVLPGTLFGAVLIQTLRNGLNFVNADPYLYPVAMGVVIFLAVALDGLRHARLRELRRRTIRPPGQPETQPA